MATYKVLQDIEAEDKFLGPLTLKQFIYAAITLVSAYISFLGITRGAWPIAAVLSPIMLFGGFLAWPWSKDQPTEVWLLAKIRFGLKPRRRIWDQNGMKDLVSITVPKHVEQYLTNGLSQVEVKSRLQALANTIDSRGWAVKNVNVNMFSQPSYVLDQADSDRLIDPSTLSQAVPETDVAAVDDILDEHSNPTAQHFDSMISASSQAHRQQAVANMHQPTDSSQPASGTSNGSATPANYWFMNGAGVQAAPGSVAFTNPAVITPGTTSNSFSTTSSTAEEAALLEKIHNEAQEPDPTNYHMRTVEPVSPGLQTKRQQKNDASKTSNKAQPTSTPTPDPAILDLANNDDLNVATIARQADKALNQLPDDEVVVSLR